MTPTSLQSALDAKITNENSIFEPLKIKTNFIFNPQKPELNYDNYVPNQTTIITERWTENIQLKGRVYKIDKKSKLVFCDCIIFDENDEKKFEKRQFPLYLFENINELSESTLVMISIKRKAGTMRIDIKDGRGVVEKSDFEIQDLWDF